MLAAETSGRYWGGLKLKGWDSTLPVWAGASLLLVLLMAFPLGAIFSTSVRNQAGLTFGNYAEVFTKPAFLSAIAWTLLAGPNAGALNKLFRAVTGGDEFLFNIFTMTGLIFVMALYSFPYAFSMIANVCELISSDLEDAAVILGANKLKTAWTITLPLALPALLSGFIIAFLHSLSLFGAPAILGLPAGIHTITTQIWTLF